MAQMKKGAWVAGLLVVAAVVAAAKFMMNKPAEETAETKESSTATTTAVMPAMEANPTTMQAVSTREIMVEANYQNPAGTDDVAFRLVVDKDGVITDAKTDILAIHDISKKRQEAFAAELPTVLKGKKLSELSAIDRVGGSSLTTDAFNAALPQFKAKL